MQTVKKMFYGILDKTVARVISTLLVGSIVIAMFTGASISKYQIAVIDEETVTYIYTSSSDPADVMDVHGIVLNEGDEYTFSGIVNKCATITINRAFDVTVSADSVDYTVKMASGTAGEALALAGVTLNDDDLINVSLSEPVYNGTKIAINRVTYDEVSKTSVIPFGIDKTGTPTLKKGATRSLSAGQNGEMLTTSKRTFIDGVVVDTQVISETVVKNPVNARMLVGDPNAPASALKAPASLELDANGNPVNYKNKYVGKATAYSALGRKTSLVPGDVAMNLSIFPRGTKLYIKTVDGSFTYGYSEVRDTGTAVSDGRVLVDLFFNSYAESVCFGAKQVEVYVLN